MQLRKNPKLLTRGKAKGFTLVELLIVFGILAVAVYLVFGQSNQARRSVAAEAESNFIVGLIPTIDRMRDQNAGFLGVNAQTLVASGFIDKSFIRGTGLITPSALPVVAEPVEFRTIANNALQLTIAGYPRATCTDLATRAVRNGKIQRISLNGAVVHDVPAAVIATSATITAQCVDENNAVILLVS